MKKMLIWTMVVCILLSIPHLVSAKPNSDFVGYSYKESGVPYIKITGIIEFDCIKFNLHVLSMNNYKYNAMTIGCLYRKVGNGKWNEASKGTEFISMKKDVDFFFSTDDDASYEVRFYRCSDRGSSIKYISKEFLLVTPKKPELIITNPEFRYIDNDTVVVNISICQFEGRNDGVYFWAEVARDHDFLDIIGRYFNDTPDYKIKKDYPFGAIVLDNLPQGEELCIDLYIETPSKTIIIDDYCLDLRK